MTTPTTTVSLHEWKTLGPANCESLTDFFLDDSSDTRSIVEELSQRNLLGIRELRHGLEIAAYSHVGRIRIGHLYISILPKIQSDSLLPLIRYAYGFRRLQFVSDSTHFADKWGFEDLLIIQLNWEIQTLICSGLLRSYTSQEERLSSPRGRIDINRLAKEGGIVTATLPCIHHPRITDTLLNRVLLAGVRMAGTMASMIELRRDSRRLASIMQEQVSSIHLDATILERAMRQMNRLTAAYGSALKIIQLLLEAQGISLNGRTIPFSLRGFLFDMNAFFQALLSRFLKENLGGYTVRDEYSLTDVLKYNPEFNPQRKKPPTPRPDYVVLENGVVKSVLDAKYRDLWQNPIPREMLYQLAVYAISRPENPRSAILYPTTDASAKEARIDISDLVFGKQIGQVCIRPVHLPTLVEMIMDTAPKGHLDRTAFANELVFGKTA